MSWLNRSQSTCGGNVAGGHLADGGWQFRLLSAMTGGRFSGVLSLTCLLLLCSFATAEEGTDAEVVRAEKATGITAADVDLWVRNLDSDHYADRQAAMKNLRRSGTVGIPALTAAARGSNLESTVRSIELLTQMYESADTEVALAADEALESLGEHGPAVAVVRTQQALSTTLAQNRRRHAIAAVKRMGGSIIPTTTLDDEGEKEVELDLSDEGTIANVILGRRWTGGLNGVKYLQRLPDLRNLIMTKDIPLTPDEQDQLRAKLAGVRIELRGSAYLGIKSQHAPNQEPCIVNHVVPKSPADLGGLQARDIITHLDGTRVNDFPALTELLSTKHGGEVVYLEICRGDEFLELEVTLREW